MEGTLYKINDMFLICLICFYFHTISQFIMVSIEFNNLNIWSNSMEPFARPWPSWSLLISELFIWVEMWKICRTILSACQRIFYTSQIKCDCLKKNLVKRSIIIYKFNSTNQWKTSIHENFNILVFNVQYSIF